MVHAYILAVYKNHKQVIRLYERLRCTHTIFVIHICLNADKEFVSALKNYFKNKTDVHFCKRERATIFRIGIVKGIMNAISLLIDKNIHFDYVSSLSGQDYPIKSNNEINDFLKLNTGKEFITYHRIDSKNDKDYIDTVWKRSETFRYEDYWIKLSKKGPLYRFPVNKFINKSLWTVIKVFLYEFPTHYKEKKLLKEAKELILSRIFSKQKTFIKGFEPYGGWAWWTLTYSCAKYKMETYTKNPQLEKFFKYTWTPDEMIYQTIILNSPFKVNVINSDLREIYFPDESTDGAHPYTYTSDDFERLKNSKHFFARKFDMNKDSNILDLIDKHLLKINFNKNE